MTWMTSKAAGIGTPEQVLRTVFGFAEFRGPQRQVIDQILGGGNALLLMPTGMGKSLCYQLSARILTGLSLVISPLIALMKDQVDAAQKKGLRCTFINSSLSAEQRRDRLRRLSRGEYELVYVTPERFQKPEFRSAVKRQPIAMLAIDEAHCISAWGHDFRPDYSRLGEIREFLGEPPTLALTATATIDVQNDILKQLGLTQANCPIFQTGLDRPELALSVHEVFGRDEKLRAIVGLRHQYPGPSVVYVSLVQTLREISNELNRLGLTHLTYHGQLSDRDRSRNQEAFLDSDDALMIATPAFGLGVDKANIRSVIHAELPGSVEAYYQEIGRAGRDRQPAIAALLFEADDLAIQMEFLKWANPEPAFIRTVHELIRQNPARVRQEGLEFLRSQMNFYNRRDFRVETAVGLLERYGSLRGSSSREWEILAEPEGEYLDQELWQKRTRGQQTKLHEMLRFARTENCRMQFIREYFGVDQGKACGNCDRCVQPAETPSTGPS